MPNPFPPHTHTPTPNPRRPVDLDPSMLLTGTSASHGQKKKGTGWLLPRVHNGPSPHSCTRLTKPCGGTTRILSHAHGLGLFFFVCAEASALRLHGGFLGAKDPIMVGPSTCNHQSPASVLEKDQKEERYLDNNKRRCHHHRPIGWLRMALRLNNRAIGNWARNIFSLLRLDKLSYEVPLAPFSRFTATACIHVLGSAVHLPRAILVRRLRSRYSETDLP